MLTVNKRLDCRKCPQSFYLLLEVSEHFMSSSITGLSQFFMQSDPAFGYGMGKVRDGVLNIDLSKQTSHNFSPDQF